MVLLIWDASALAKRYTAEQGRATVNALFAAVPLSNMASTPWGYAETFSILLRRFNGGVLDARSFTTAVTALQSEVSSNPDFALFTVSDTAIFRSVGTMQRHNLNVTDAAILTVVLEIARSGDAPVCVVVASDKRLLPAAEAEGLRTVNPETLPVSAVAALLTSLGMQYWECSRVLPPTPDFASRSLASADFAAQVVGVSRKGDICRLGTSFVS